jgi:prevent-host-death family protein
MTKLQDMKALAGQAETITVSDFRRQPGEVFQQVEMGKRFTITKCGKVIAQIIPAKPVIFLEPSSQDKRKKSK